MEVKYFIKDNGGDAYPRAESNMVSDGIDQIELLLSSDLDSKAKVSEFGNTVFKKKEMWWFNATEAEESGGLVTISLAFDAAEVVKLDTRL